MCFYKSNGIKKSVSFPFPGTSVRVVRGPARPAVQLLLSTPRKGYHLHRLQGDGCPGDARAQSVCRGGPGVPVLRVIVMR